MLACIIGPETRREKEGSPCLLSAGNKNIKQLKCLATRSYQQMAVRTGRTLAVVWQQNPKF